MKKVLSIIFCVCLMAVLICIPVAAAPFADVEDHWAEDSIDRWAEDGIIEGVGENAFNPSGTMTRAQAAAIFARLLKLEDTADISGFTDVDPEAAYADAIAKCVAAGIMNGVGGDMMDPNGLLTREQMMVMLCRALGIEPEATCEKEFTDADEVSDWAEGYVNALVNAGIVDGIGDNTMAPDADIDRASTMTLLDKAIAGYANEDGETLTVEEGKTGVVLVVADNVWVNNAPAGTTVVTGTESNGTVVNGSVITNDTVHEVPVHYHTWGAWVSNEDGTHTRVLNCGHYATQTEDCDGAPCSKCGYIVDAEAKIGTTYYTSLADAIEAGGTVTVLKNATITKALVITSNTTLILNGNTVTVGAISGGDRPFNIEANNVSFTIDATAAGSSINYGSSNYGFVEVGNRSTNPTVTDIKITVNGGTYTGGSTGGAIFRFRGDSTASLTLNNVTWTDSATGTYGAITDVNNSPDIAVVSITVNGGIFTTNSGFCATAPSSFTGATINTKGYGIEVGSSTATVSGCTITVDPGIVHGTAPAACVAAAGGANITVSNSTLEVVSGIYCLETYPSGGHITANNCTFTGSVSHMYAIDETNYPGATCSITVNNPVIYAPSNTGELMTLLQTVADGSTILLAPVNYSTDYAVTLGGGHFNETLPKNITIIGNANATIDFAVNKSNGSIPFDGAMDGWVFKNVNFVGSGFRLQNGATATNIRLEGCTFTGGATFYSLAASGGYVSGATIYDCEFYDTVNSGVNKNAISIQDARNIKIEACTFSNVRNAINFGSSATGNMVITGNTVIGTTDRVLRITDGGATYTITSNTITSNGDSAGQVIKIDNADITKITLTDNTWNLYDDEMLGYANGVWSLPTNTAN